MHAVIKTGAHQYRVQAGDLVSIDKIPGEVGDKVSFDQVLMLGSNVGSPLIAGAKVSAVIKEQTRAPKIIIMKFKRRKGYKRTKGHKQPYTVVEIAGVQ